MRDDIDTFRNFHDFFQKCALRYGEKPCLTDAHDPLRIFSFAQVDEKVNQASRLLSSLHISKRDRFATLMHNCVEFFFLYLASLKMGTLIMPIPAGTPAQEVEGLAKTFGLKALFADADHAETGAQAWERIHGDQSTLFSVSADSSSRFCDFNKALDTFRSSPLGFGGLTLDDPGSLYFSSGTTGEPKGIPQSARNLLSSASALAEAYGFTETDTQMGVLPVYHTALATYGFWPGVCVGSNFVLCRKFSRSRFWADIARHKIAFVETVPTILAMLLNPAQDIKKYDISCLKFIGSGSAPLSVNLQEQFERTYKVNICNKYGLSETAPTHCNPPQPSARKIGSIGRPLAMCEVRIVDDRDGVLAPSEIGEVIIRGPNVIKGYFNNPEADKKSFRNGWFHTGDLAYADKDGFYFLVDRIKDIINRGGAKIYPNEVDNLLFSHPSVAEAVTFALKDKIYGEEVAACVKLKEGLAIQETELAEFCRKNLAQFKCPKRIFIVESIPKTHSGKVLRRELASRYHA